MAAPTLLVAASFAFATAFLYAYVGRVVHRRDVEGDARLAARLFAIFWYAISLVGFTTALTLSLAWLDRADPVVILALSQAIYLLLSIGLWALLYYFAYLFFGSPRLLWPISVFYAAFYVWTLYLFAASGAPVGVDVTAWTATLRFSDPIPPHSPAVALFGILLLVPPLAGVLAYASLWFRVRNRTQRYRIGMVAVTIFLWFGASLVVTLQQAGGADWWQLTSRLLGIAAAALVVFAYRPPAWIRRRFGIRAIDEPQRS